MTTKWDILPYIRDGRKDIPFLILMPSRTAMRGKFPLNGTFFQVRCHPQKPLVFNLCALFSTNRLTDALLSR